MHAVFENPIHSLKYNMMRAFPKTIHTSCGDTSGAKPGKVQWTANEFTAVTLVRQAMKMISSGSHFLWEPEIWRRRSLGDREDYQSEGREKLQKSLKEEERVLPGHGNTGHQRTGRSTLAVSALETHSQ